MTAIKYADRVLETSTTTGTSTLNLAGPAIGAQSFVDGVGHGSMVAYFIEDGTNWEAGIGTVTSGTPDTLSRTTVLESSNSNALVNWGAGTRNVFLGNSSHMQVWRDSNKNCLEGFSTAGGTGNAQTLTLNPVPLAYSDGMLLAWFSAGDVTSAATVNANGLGAKTLKWRGASLAAGSFSSGDLMVGRYKSSTGFVELLTPPRYVSLKAKGTAIASATTTDIGAADSQYISVTGTTTITGLGSSTIQDHVWVEFDGILTLTHNATSLILPTAANITTAAGDVAEFVRISGSNWKCVDYQRADGYPVKRELFVQSGIVVASAAARGPYAHGFGVIPTVSAEAVCTTAEYGFSIGDVIELNPVDSSGSANGQGFAIKKDATNINLKFGSATNPIIYINFSSGAVVSLTAANWTVTLRARP